MQMSEESKSLVSGTEEDFDPKPPAKKAKKTAKETSKEPKEATEKGKKKGGKSPNKTSSTKEKKKPAKKPAKKKGGDDEEESKMDVEDENFNPNLEKEDESNGSSDNDFDEESSEKPSKSKKGKSASAKKNAKPSAKGKKAGVAKDEETDVVLDYMKKQNRPYSLINIFDNLHGKIKKPQVQRILDSLTDAGELQMKEFGKAKIYLLNQKSIPDVNQVELDKISKEVQELRNTHRELTDEVKGLNVELKDLQNQLTDEQLDAEIVKYEKLMMDAESKLKVYESGNYPKISDEVMKKAEEGQQRYEKEYKRRKKMCMDMVHQVSEMSEQKVAVLLEEIGLDV